MLSGIDLSIACGKCCAIIGPNGAGKSTLIAVMSGYIWPTRGSVEVLGRRYGRVDISEVRRHIGLIESSRVPTFSDWLPVRSVVATGLFGTIVLPSHRPIDWDRVDSELAALGLSALSSSPFGRLSTGERMKILIARAVVSEPELLILDEPTAGLDIASRVGVVKSLERLLSRPDGPTLVVVSHHLEELPYPLDQVVLLKDGSILDKGSPAGTLSSAKLSEAFGCDVDSVCKGGRYFTTVSSRQWDI